MMKDRIVDFIIEFMEDALISVAALGSNQLQDIDKEIKDLKIALNTRLRAAAS